MVAAGEACKMGKPAPDQRAPPRQCLDEWQAETFRHRGAHDVCGVGQPIIERATRSSFRRDPVHHRELNGDPEFGGEVLPHFVDRESGGIAGSAGDGGAGSRRSHTGKQYELAEVLAPDAAHRREHQRLRGRTGWQPLDGNRIGQQVGTLRHQSGGDETLPVARVEKCVMHIRPMRIELLAIAEKARVFRPAVFREIVDVQQQARTLLGEPSHDFGQARVFSQGMVVKMPDVRHPAEGLTCRMAHGLQQFIHTRIRAAIAQTGHFSNRNILAGRNARLASQDHGFHSACMQAAARAADHLRHAAIREMIVDDGDFHSAFRSNPRPRPANRRRGLPREPQARRS